jgi:hypothetical protein
MGVRIFIIHCILARPAAHVDHVFPGACFLGITVIPFILPRHLSIKYAHA